MSKRLIIKLYLVIKVVNYIFNDDFVLSDKISRNVKNRKFKQNSCDAISGDWIQAGLCKSLETAHCTVSSLWKGWFRINFSTYVVILKQIFNCLISLFSLASTYLNFLFSHKMNWWIFNYPWIQSRNTRSTNEKGFRNIQHSINIEH